MFQRNALNRLAEWKKSPKRKPLIIRGARQTGKTTLIKEFGKTYSHFISLNLEKSSDRLIWKENPDISQVLKNIEAHTGQRIIAKETLLLIDEIQNEPLAIQSLRYFYEEVPDLHVIATGSLMEVALKEKGLSFPVGRVSFLFLYPVTFFEFLTALGETLLLEELKQISFDQPLHPVIHEKAIKIFYDYVQVGGMPEVVQYYLETKSILSLAPLKEAILHSFEEDVPKYCRTFMVPYVQLLAREAPRYAGQRITYSHFADSAFRGREMKAAFEILERAFLIERVLGSHHTEMPLLTNYRVSPKLLFLDMGLVGHRLHIDTLNWQENTLNSLFRGSFAEQVVGQELRALNDISHDPLHFWYRDKAGATSEVDYCWPLNGCILPIEVKSGSSGSLKSLRQFMETAPHPYAIRIYGGKLYQENIETNTGKKIRFYSLPFYLLPRILELPTG